MLNLQLVCWRIRNTVVFIADLYFKQEVYGSEMQARAGLKIVVQPSEACTRLHM